MTMNGQLVLQQAEQLLNFDSKLDINILDSVVNCMYNSTGEEVSPAKCNTSHVNISKHFS